MKCIPPPRPTVQQRTGQAAGVEARRRDGATATLSKPQQAKQDETAEFFGTK